MTGEERPREEKAGRDPVDDILFACLDRPDSAWERAIEEACRHHPEHEEALRRRWRILTQAGMSARPEALPERLGEFRILRVLGEGGMGVVYLAEQESLQRRVAIKVIRPEHLALEKARERFRLEGLAASRLDHPCLCKVFEVGEIEGFPYMVMPFVEGESLADRLQRVRSKGEEPPARSEIRELVGSFEKVARALHVAHERGLIHRDIKPANIMIDARFEPTVLDFGLARDLQGPRHHLTLPGALMGTPVYMAPEEIAGDGRLDARTDVYSLGVTLYETVTHRCPFEDTSREALYRRILDGDVDDPRAVHPAISRDLRDVIGMAMATRPQDRYASAEALAKDLALVTEGLPPRAGRRSWVRRTSQWIRKHRNVSAFITLLSVALVVVSLFLVRARALQLAAEARSWTEVDPVRGLARAVEAYETYAGRETLSQVYRSLAEVIEYRLVDGHREPIEQAVVAPDRRAWMSADGSGRTLWHRVNGSPIEIPTTQRPKKLLFSPDSSLGVVVTDESLIVVTPGGDGSESHTVALDVLDASWFADSESLAVIGQADPGTLLLLDRQGQEQQRFMVGGHPQRVLGSPAGHSVLLVDEGGHLRLWSYPREKVLWEGRHRNRLGAIAFSPDGQRLATAPAYGTDDPAFEILLWSLDEEEEPVRLQGHGDFIQALSFACDGRRLLSASRDGTARLWDLEDGSSIAMHGHGSFVNSAALCPNATRVVTAAGDGRVRIFGTDGSLQTVLRGHHGHATLAEFLDADRVLTVSKEPQARLWTLSANPISSMRGMGGSFGPQGDVRLLESHASLTLWGGVPLEEMTSPPRRFVVDSEELRLLSLGFEGEVRIHDARGSLLASLEGAGWSVLALRGEDVLIAREDGVSYRELGEGSVRERSFQERNGVLCGALASDGRFALGQGEGTVSLWNRQGRMVWERRLHKEGVLSLMFSPDDERLLSGSIDGNALVVDVEDGGIQEKLEGHTGRIFRALFSPHPEGYPILTVSDDKSARLWNEGGEEAVLFDAHRSNVMDGCFDRKGRRVMTVGRNRVIRIWEVHPDAVLQRAAAVLGRLRGAEN